MSQKYRSGNWQQCELSAKGVNHNNDWHWHWTCQYKSETRKKLTKNVAKNVTWLAKGPIIIYLIQHLDVRHINSSNICLCSIFSQIWPCFSQVLWKHKIYCVILLQAGHSWDFYEASLIKMLNSLSVFQFMLEHKKQASEERTVVTLLNAFKANFIDCLFWCAWNVSLQSHTWHHKDQFTEIFLPSETKVNIPVWSEHYGPVLFIFCKALGSIHGRKFTPVQTLWRLKKLLE